MAALGVPTTRALAVIGGSLAVYREKGVESGGIIARVAPSWVRFGNFELFWYRGENDLLRKFADYVVKLHFPHLDETEVTLEVMHRTARVPGVSVVGNEFKRPATSGGVYKQQEVPHIERPSSAAPAVGVENKSDTIPSFSQEEAFSAENFFEGCSGLYTDFTPVVVKLNRYAKLFREVVKRSAVMVAHWQACGFIHGLLNTMVYWNLKKLGRTFVELVTASENPHDSTRNRKAIDGKDIIEKILESYEQHFIEEYTDLMAKKLGILRAADDDLELLIEPLLQLLNDTDADYTTFFRAMAQVRLTDTEFAGELGPLVRGPADALDGALYEEAGEDRASLDETLQVPQSAASIGEFLEYPSVAEYAEMQAASAAKKHEKQQSPPKPTVVAPAAVAATSSDDGGSGCLEMLLSCHRAAVAEVQHEVEVITIVQSRAAVASNDADSEARRSVVVGSDGRKSVAAAQRKSTRMSMMVNEQAADGKTGKAKPADGNDDLVLMVNDLAAENKACLQPTKHKNFRRASSIVADRQRLGMKDDKVSSQDPHDGCPSEDEIRYRWQEWLISYRSRLILEQISLNPSIPISNQTVKDEDLKRKIRMKKCNPKFNLRGWILDEICEKVSAQPDCQPFDAEISRLQEELKVLLEAEVKAMTGDEVDEELQELISKLRRGEQIKPMEEFTAERRKQSGAKSSTLGTEILNQALRILVGDIWGDRTDSPQGWLNKSDAEAAARWSGKVPKTHTRKTKQKQQNNKRKDNIVQSGTS
ncbi:hypothetical protein HDU82_004508 [Entophlyctis luteolus]|nr:hypothetical protein HDU82_004508 [Entophlyctis luteolus]